MLAKEPSQLSAQVHEAHAIKRSLRNIDCAHGLAQLLQPLRNTVTDADRVNVDCVRSKLSAQLDHAPDKRHAIEVALRKHAAQSRPVAMVDDRLVAALACHVDPEHARCITRDHVASVRCILKPRERNDRVLAAFGEGREDLRLVDRVIIPLAPERPVVGGCCRRNERGVRQRAIALLLAPRARADVLFSDPERGEVGAVIRGHADAHRARVLAPQLREVGRRIDRVGQRKHLAVLRSRQVQHRLPDRARNTDCLIHEDERPKAVEPEQPHRTMRICDHAEPHPSRRKLPLRRDPGFTPDREASLSRALVERAHVLPRDLFDLRCLRRGDDRLAVRVRREPPKERGAPHHALADLLAGRD